MRDLFSNGMIFCQALRYVKSGAPMLRRRVDPALHIGALQSRPCC